MVELTWPFEWTFTDHERGESYEGPVTTEVPDDAEDQYLDRRWEYPDDDGSTDEDAPSSDASSEDRETYPRSDLEEMSYQELREMASEADREDIDGGSKKEDIIDAFAADESEE